jgi:hypothetical protein
MLRRHMFTMRHGAPNRSETREGATAQLAHSLGVGIRSAAARGGAMSKGEQFTMHKSRQEALEKGEKSFFTGRPCIRGHVAKRSTENGSCYACLAIAVKKWRARKKLVARRE